MVLHFLKFLAMFVMMTAVLLGCLLGNLAKTLLWEPGALRRWFTDKSDWGFFSIMGGFGEAFEFLFTGANIP